MYNLLYVMIIYFASESLISMDLRYYSLLQFFFISKMKYQKIICKSFLIQYNGTDDARCIKLNLTIYINITL